MGSAASQLTLDANDDDEKHEDSQNLSPRFVPPPTPGLRFQIELEQKPLRAGHLLKRGFKNFASWKRRYCVLLKGIGLPSPPMITR